MGLPAPRPLRLLHRHLLPVLLALACSRPNPSFMAEGLPEVVEPPPRDAGAEWPDSADRHLHDEQTWEAPDPQDAEPDAGPDTTTDTTTDTAIETSAETRAETSAEAGPIEAAADAPGETASDLAPDTTPSPGLCPDDPDLLLCLRFEGQAQDQSPGRLPISPPVSLNFTPGLDGLAGAFTTATRLEVRPSPLLDATPALTIEAWVKPSALPTGSARMGIVDYTREYAMFLHPGGDLECIVVTDEGQQDLRIDVGIPAGVWTSVGCMATQDRIMMWINGREFGSMSSDELEPSGSTNTLVVGGNFSSSAPDPFVGQVDNVRVWRRVRTRPEMCASAGPLCR